MRVHQIRRLIIGHDSNLQPLRHITARQPTEGRRLASPQESAYHQEAYFAHKIVLSDLVTRLKVSVMMRQAKIMRKLFNAEDSKKLMDKSSDAARPAILGGKPLFPEGPPAWPPAWEEVSMALKQSLAEGSWGHYHGPNTRLLIERLAAYHEVEFVELCCSGTFAIELALRALQIGAGDEVIWQTTILSGISTTLSLSARGQS